MRTIRNSFFPMMAALLLISFKPGPVESLLNRYDQIYLPPAAKASWVSVSHNFGNIPRGTPVTVEFSFTNTGDEPLIIKDVVTSCGCTASDYTLEPIMPGKSSKIKVSFNAANKGAFTKTITVNSNDQEATKLLQIKGVVI